MYTLYYMPGVCSRAIHALLYELDASVEIKDKSSLPHYDEINPTGQVPVLVDQSLVLREGAAIILHLLDKHGVLSRFSNPEERARFIQQLMFANATMHPAYGRLFFISQAISDSAAREEAYGKAAEMIDALWAIVDQQLESSEFVCGDEISVVDMMLTVYANWGDMFPVDISLGKNVKRMIEQVKLHPSFRKAIEREEAAQAA